MRMDRWKYFAVTHRDHVICNPTSEARIDELISLLELEAGARVLDIACGKAELLVRLAERHQVVGEGVDLSPHFIRDARALAASRVPGASLTFHEMAGADYQAAPHSFDLAMCLGASWALGGHAGTLEALRRAVRPGGLVVVGEPFWRRAPEPEYLAASGLNQSDFGTHFGNVATGVAAGLALLYAMVSNDDDWDRYEGLRWRAAERYFAANPGDPDAQEIVERQRGERDAYLQWGRETLGWAMYVFRT